MSCSSDEVSALVDRFMVVGARWCLSSAQVANLLGLPGALHPAFDEADLVWALRCGKGEAERRMRLLVDVDGKLCRLVPHDRDLAAWLRTPSVGYIDELATPLDAMASGAAAVRALRDYLDDLGDGGRLTA